MSGRHHRPADRHSPRGQRPAVLLPSVGPPHILHRRRDTQTSVTAWEARVIPRELRVPEGEGVLLVRDVSRATMLRVIGKYKAGHYAQLPELIRHFRCRRVHIRCDRESEINLDGELMMSRDVTFEIAPQSIRFFYPRGLTYHAAAEQGGEHIAAT